MNRADETDGTASLRAACLLTRRFSPPSFHRIIADIVCTVSNMAENRGTVERRRDGTKPIYTVMYMEGNEMVLMLLLLLLLLLYCYLYNCYC